MPIKLLLVIESLSIGGKERQFVQLARNISKNVFYEVNIVLYKNLIEYEISELELKRFFIINTDNKYGLIKSLVQIIRKVKPDIVHSWEVISPFAAFFSSFFNKPIIVNGSIRYAVKFKPLSKRNIISKASFLISDKIIANSYKGLENSGLSKSHKSKVIYNGIDINFEERYNAISRDFDLVCVANLLPSKDHETLITSVVKFCNEIRPIKLLIIGDGPKMHELKQLIPNHLKHLIYFYGKSKNVFPLLAKSKVGVLLTNDSLSAEGISNSIMEYMVAGLPVIATKGGGTPELVQDGQNGFLIPAYDSEALINSIQFLLDNEVQCQLLGKHSREIIVQKFSTEVMLHGFLDVYNSMIDKNNKQL